MKKHEVTRGKTVESGVVYVDGLSVSGNLLFFVTVGAFSGRHCYRW